VLFAAALGYLATALVGEREEAAVAAEGDREQGRHVRRADADAPSTNGIDHLLVGENK
jgi:hypothetical protein